MNELVIPFACSLMLQLNQELEQDESRILQHQVGSPITSSPPGRFICCALHCFMSAHLTVVFFSFFSELILGQILGQVTG